MNKLESLKQQFLALYRLIARGSEALNDQQWIVTLLTRTKQLPLLVYRPTPPLPHLWIQEIKSNTEFNCAYFGLLGAIPYSSTDLNWKLLGLLLAGTGVIGFCISRMKQRPNKGSTTMVKADIKIPDSLNFLFQEKIDELRKKYERSYANSHDEAFNLITTQMFQQLASIMTFSTNSKAFLVERLQQGANLVINFNQQYQELIATDFREALLKLGNFFNLQKQLLEAFVLIEAGDEEKGKAKKYISYQQGYQLLGGIAKNNWIDLSVEMRDDFEMFALQVQSKTGFGVKKEAFAELQQSWNELGKQLNLFWASIKSGRGDLFSNYKDAVLYFINSVLEAAKNDSQLQNYKEKKLLKEPEKFSTITSILNYVKTAPKWHGEDFTECLDYINDIRS